MSEIVIGKKSLLLVGACWVVALGQMSGTYTIKPTGGDFPSFVAAAAALKSQGVGGDCRFVAYSGTYTGSVVLRNIAVGSFSIVFCAAPGESVTIEAGALYAFRVDTTRNVTIEGLRVRGASGTNSATIRFYRSSGGRVKDCVVGGSTNTKWGVWVSESDSVEVLTTSVTGVRSTLAAALYFNAARGCRVRNCTTGGAPDYGIQAVNSDSLVIEGTTVTAASGTVSAAIYLSSMRGARVVNCSTNTDSKYGIWLEKAPGARVENTSVRSTAGTVTAGILLDDADSSIVRGCIVRGEPDCGIKVGVYSDRDSIIGNQVLTTRDYGIFLEGYTPSSPGVGTVVANNYVRGWTENGIRLYRQSGTGLYYNTVIGPTPSATGKIGVHLYSAVTGLTALNNIIWNTGTGTSCCYSIQGGSSFARSDYNDLLSPAGVVGRIGSTSYATLDAWRGTAGGPDSNSISEDPQFIVAGDPHIRPDSPCRFKGTRIPGIGFDLDSQPRDTVRPCIGADEYYGKDAGITAILSPSREVLVGTDVLPQVTLKSFGTEDVTLDVRLVISDSAGAVVYDTVGQDIALPAGATRNHTFTRVWPATSLGRYGVLAYTLLEGDLWPGNDTARVAVRVVVRDAGASVVLAPAGSLPESANVAPWVRARNYGTQDVTVALRCLIADSGGAVVYDTTEQGIFLAAGDSTQRTFTKTWRAAPVGAYSVLAHTILAGDQNPGNDTCRGSCTVFLADVGVSALAAPAGTVDSGTTVVPACTVYNYGTVPGTYTVRMRIGTAYDEVVNVTDHAPGASLVLNFPAWTALRRGSQAVSCSTRLVGDRRPANNRKTGTVSIRVLDAAAVRILAPSGVIDSGAAVTPSAVVRNRGTESASFTVWFRIEHGTDEGPGGYGLFAPDLPVAMVWQSYLDSVQVAVGAGDSALVQFRQWRAETPDTYRLAAFTTLAGDMVPANDTMRGQVVVSKRVHDVAAIQILAPTGQMDSGTVVVPRAVVQNRGTVPETFRVRLAIGSTYSDTQQVTIGRGAADTVDFAAWVAGPVGMLAVSCSTMLTGDGNPANDRVLDSVIVNAVGAIREEAGLPIGRWQFSIAPNPIANGFATLRLQGFQGSRVEGAHLRVFDAAGRCVLVQAVANSQSPMVLDLSRLPAGVYAVRVEVEGLSVWQKLIVQRYEVEGY